MSARLRVVQHVPVEDAPPSVVFTGPDGAQRLLRALLVSGDSDNGVWEGSVNFGNCGAKGRMTAAVELGEL